MSKTDQWRTGLNRADVVCQNLRNSLENLRLTLQEKSDSDYSNDERVKITARIDILLSQLQTLSKWPAGELKKMVNQS